MKSFSFKKLLVRFVFSISVVTFPLFFGSPVLAESKTFIVEATSYIGDNQTKNDARNLATLEAKRKALEQAGVYVNSLTIVKNSVIESDEILAFTAGVTKTEIQDEKAIANGDSFGLQVIVKVTIDTDSVDETLRKFSQDQQEKTILIAQQKTLIIRNKQLEDELNSYKLKLSQLSTQEVINAKNTEGKILNDKLAASNWFQEGMDFYEIGQYQKAINSFSKTINSDPNFYQAYAYRGFAHLYIGQSNDAVSDLDKSIKLKYDFSLAYYFRAFAHLEENNLSKAISDINMAVAISPKTPIFHVGRGMMYLNKNSNYEVINNINIALSLNSKDANAYYIRAIAYLNLNRVEQALNDFDEAIKLKPNSSQFLVFRGAIYSNSDKHQEALDDFTKVINFDPIVSGPFLSQAFIGRADLYLKLKEYNKAKSDFSSACELGLTSACSVLEKFK